MGHSNWSTFGRLQNVVLPQAVFIKPCLLSGGGTGQAAADFLLAVVRQGHVDDFLIRGDDAVKALVRLDQAELATR